MRCQLCDGPVVGGRCKSCGMPYKNDAVLYHVNEDRKTHDRHASEKAREELRKRLAPSETVKKAQQPQPQRKTTGNAAGNRTAYRAQKHKKTAKTGTVSASEKGILCPQNRKKRKNIRGFSDPVVSDHIFAGNPGSVGYMAEEHSSK